jgi:ABC-type proline/glycine betaine transport system substrate-binding protein
MNSLLTLTRLPAELWMLQLLVLSKEETQYFLLWEPTGLMGKVDWVKLKEPAYDADCWGKMITVVRAIKEWSRRYKDHMRMACL